MKMFNLPVKLRQTAGLLILGAISAPFAHAATVVVNVTTGNYATPATWYNTTTTTGTVPGASDDAVVNLNRAVTLNSVASSTLKSMTVSNSSNTGTFNVQTGASLTITGFLRVSAQGASNGSVIQTGGAIAVSGSGTNAFAIASATGGLTPGNALYQISGGSLNVTSTANVNLGQSTFSSGSGTGTLQIIGSTSTVNFNTLNVNATGVLKFNFDASSVSTLNITNSLNLNGTSAALVIDGTNFTGGAGTYDLVSSGSISGTFNPSAVSITGFSSDLAQSIVYDGGKISLLLTSAAIPETSTFALLGGLGALGLALVSRRMRS